MPRYELRVPVPTAGRGPQSLRREFNSECLLEPTKQQRPIKAPTNTTTTRSFSSLMPATKRSRCGARLSDRSPQFVGAVSLDAGADPNREETLRYTKAHQRSMSFLNRVLEIEAELYDTTATTTAGLMYQVVLLREAVFPSDHEGRRLLNSIISGIEGWASTSDQRPTKWARAARRLPSIHGRPSSHPNRRNGHKSPLVSMMPAGEPCARQPIPTTMGAGSNACQETRPSAPCRTVPLT
jgi:hypothetical protein